MNFTEIAKITHEVNKAYCESLGDYSQVHWDDAPDWQRESVCKGVLLHLQHPDTTPEETHNSWLKQKQEEGWSYGPVKDASKKQHPCFVPYNELPQEQRSKDHIFKAIIESLRHLAWPID